jgi:excisionase family DNA binding protein
VSLRGSHALAAALLDALDDDALDVLAERLAPRLEARIGRRAGAEASGDRWMTTDETASYLGMTPNALHKLTAARAIPFAQDGPGCRCYFRRSDLDRWRESGARGRRP